MIKLLVTATVQGYRRWFKRDCHARNFCLHTYFAHRGSDLPLHFISVCNRDLVTTGFGGMKPSRHTCRCQCPSRNRRIFQRYLETHPFGRRVSIITAADHSTKSVPFLLPFP